MPETKDTLLDDYLAGNSEVSRLYREIPKESSPTTLDDQILRAARRELRPKPRRWMVPLSMAAAVLLSMSVILQLPKERMTPQPSAHKPVAEETAPAAAPSMADAPAAVAQRNTAAPSRQTPAAPAPAPTAEPLANSAESISLDHSPAVEEKQEAAPITNQPAAKKAFAVERDRAAPSAGMLAPSRDEPRPASLDERSEMTPESWIEHIRELRRTGKSVEAASELKNFRARYPDYVLPPDLTLEEAKPAK
jgi:hypothetical protein